MSTAAPKIGNSPQSYGAVAKTLHWLTALLILTAIPLGVIANDMGYDTSQALALKAWLFSLHKTVGVAAFFVALLRILWAATQPKPALLHPDRRLESFAAETVHWALYASLVIVPLSGWLHHAATSGFAPIWWPFGQTLPFVPVNEGVAHFFGAWHWLFTKVLIAALALHIAGALKHHFIDKDATLARMLPGLTLAGDTTAAHPRAPMKAALAFWVLLLAAGSVLGLSSDAERQAASPQLQAEPSGWTVKDGRLAITALQLGSEVEGQFEEWNAAINFDPDLPSDVKGDVTVQIAIPSLKLGSVTSDALKPEFFAAEEFPTATFTAEITEADGENSYLADGVLSLKGVEQPLALPFTLVIDGDTAQMEAKTVIDRRDFGIGTASYNDESTVAYESNVTVTLTAVRSE
ncbi:cytochrome b/b6 domain-containing protein [Meridianimarinicoccus aquatilis]|uniref:Cytochrome n=1 Tax=Meridianimarinicoccus aquatilis TaxID=2552766 RepID=A0A4R6B2U0_9RHOB|nr:cytochrome b/b6 domain-containing protein [Fluviibacterium aquatile]TDL89508.1 cytochrome [Fluviibacterium aquatile]